MTVITRSVNNTTTTDITLQVPGYDTVKPPVVIPASTTVDLFTVLTGDELEAIQPTLNQYISSGEFTVVATVDTSTFNPIGGATPGGADMQIQFNDAGAFAGDPNLIWDSGAQNLGITGSVSAGSASLSALHISNSPANWFFTTFSNSLVITNNVDDSGIAITGSGSISPADPSAILDLQSLDRGLLPPRMTGTQRDAIVSPAEGLVIWNLDTHTINAFNGTSWLAVTLS